MNPLALDAADHKELESVESRINACLDYIALLQASDSPHTRSSERGALAMIEAYLNGAMEDFEIVMGHIQQRIEEGGAA